MTKYKLPEIELKDERYCTGCHCLIIGRESIYPYCNLIESFYNLQAYIYQTENEESILTAIRSKDCPLIEVK